MKKGGDNKTMLYLFDCDGVLVDRRMGAQTYEQLRSWAEGGL